MTLGPRRIHQLRVTLIVLGGVAALITLVREGAFAPYLATNVGHYTAHRTFNTTTTTGGNTTVIGDGPAPRLANHYVECLVSCSPLGAMCDGFKARFNCDNDHPERVARGPKVMVLGSVGFGPDPFCYTPLYKSGNASLGATLNIGLTTPDGSASHTFMLNNDLTQTMTGVASCRTFRQLLGEEAAVQLMNALNQYFRAN